MKRARCLVAPAVLAAAIGSTQARADAPVSVGVSGAVDRASQSQDAIRNTSAASFGAPTTDDRRLFTLRWRLPFVLLGGGGGDGPFASRFSSTGVLAPGGIALAAEPMEDLSAFIPHFKLGEDRKAVHVQAGVLSADMGHGTLVHRYTNSPEGSVRRGGVLLEGNLAGLGGEVMVGDVTSPHSFFAGRVHGRPLMWFMAPDATFQPNELDLDPRTEATGIWVTGLSWALDADAPLTPEAADPERAFVFGGGWDNELALLDNQAVKAIAYLDLNLLAGNRTGMGFGVGAHPGMKLMFDVFGVRVDVDGEYNVGTDAYVPRYFDRLYAIERELLYGTDHTKASADAPASHGYGLKLSAGILESITLYAEASDQFAFDDTRGANSARVTVGAAGWVFFFGGNVSLTQAGIHEYLDPHLGGPGFMAVAEGRVALIANVFHVVGRYWRVHAAGASGEPTDVSVDQGALMGLEVNLDVL